MRVFDELKNVLKTIFSKEEYEYSNKWKEYRLGVSKTHCVICYKRNHKIYLKTEVPLLPEHERCVCYLTWLRKVLIGQATRMGEDGADFYLNKYGRLPDYYITKEQAYELGWKPFLGNLNEVAHGKMLGGDLFLNRENKLPNATGRIWFECDIDYDKGYRNNSRLIYSNDGLIFKTDDHYSRFIAVE